MSIVIVKDNIAEALEALRRAKKRGLEAIAAAGEKNAKLKITEVVYDTPESPNYKRTGRLLDGISHAIDNNFAYIGTNVEYGQYVELGTSKMKARPFLKPAATEHDDEYKNLMRESLKNA